MNILRSEAFQPEMQLGVPPRSKLYNLDPVGIGTAQVESLTSYLNRLAWTYRVGPRVFLAQEIVPHLQRPYYFQVRSTFSAFCHTDAVSINGTAESAIDWSATLGRVTMRADLQNLTLLSWGSSLPVRGLLRAAPAWCSQCYLEWREEGLPIYQPLLWMLQVMTGCPRHRRPLEDQCPICLKRQAIFAAYEVQPGHCTQCHSWLGSSSDPGMNYRIDDEIFEWQKWAMGVIGELSRAGSFSGETLLWERLAAGVAACAEVYGGVNRLSRFVNIRHGVLLRWIGGQRMPAFQNILTFCYTLGISPLSLMMNDVEAIREVAQTGKVYRLTLPKPRAPSKIDYERALKLIRDVLNGSEAPQGVRQVERRLGLSSRVLVKWFPQECALISAQYRAYRAEQAKQRMARACEEVRKVTLLLHDQGMNPSRKNVSALLSDPNMLLGSQVRATWRAVRREIGLEQ